MKTKYIVIVPDGMADKSVSSLGNKTPLEAARTPGFDRMARECDDALLDKGALRETEWERAQWRW